METTTDVAVISERDEHARRADEIRSEGMPKPRPVVREPTWGEVVQAHLRVERRLGIRGRASCSP